MVNGSSRPHTSAALLDDEPDVSRRATCPMCHTQAPVTRNAIEVGADWRCVRCGQHWNAPRLAAVAAYAAWRVEHDRRDRRATEDREDASRDDNSPAARQGGTS